MAVSIKLGKSDTGSGSFLVNVGDVYTVQTKGDGTRSSMVRRDIFSSRQDGAKSFTGRVIGVEIDEKNQVVLILDCSHSYHSVVRKIPVNTISRVTEE